MRSRLIFASILTSGILASFIFFVFYLLAFWANVIDFTMLVVLTVITNLVLWLVSPKIMDWMQGFFYNVRWVTFDEFSREHTEVANPTAYCYGSYPSNARIVVSEGIFKYLDIEEQKAVLDHELGHIINKDFIIMTIAVTLLQILYEIHYYFLKVRKVRSRGKKDITPMIKIAYGIAIEVDTDSTQRLLSSTRAMGIYDFKAAQSIGTVFKIVTKMSKEQSFRDLTRIFLFDIVSPWALVSEINSTHPLTGKRIRALSVYVLPIL
jgi:Zn-dependent protease with chaperone function